ncbi:WhiB family transcriptional regulator [Streptomyces sp. NPDC086783]|uniref:WhiB family transcriptional regulator n=1 Tax=Streptomyces sp. NPDC086783 TaxID=3365758 RepID=UPI0038064ED2
MTTFTEDWHDRAACVNSKIDPEIFFPASARSRGWETLPKKVCQACPVTDPCFRMAIQERITDGIWGGLTGWERHKRGGPRPTRGRRPKYVDGP